MIVFFHEDVSQLLTDRRTGRVTPMAPLDDVPLVIAAREGDAASFNELYRRYGKLVHGVLLGRSTRTAVDDLMQDVFLTAWRRLHTLRDPGAFGGWLVSIARHALIDHVRQQRPHEVVPDGLGAPDPDRLEAQRALEAIRQLPEAYRDTLILRLVEGMTGPEIAARTGLTPGSVRVNLCRGMKLLRSRLDG